MVANKGLKTAFTACIISILLVGMLIPLVNTGAINVDIATSKISIRLTDDGNTLYVGGSGPDNYTRIQDAIDNASDGETVFVYDDSSPYYENVRINKSITLTGENKETTIIDGSDNNSVVRIIVGNVTVQKFTLINAERGVLVKKEIYLTSGISHVNIRHNIVINNALEGISLWRCDYSTVYGNHVQNNMWGISLYGCHFTTVTRNNLIDNVTDFLFKENMHIYYWSDFYFFFTNRLSGNYWDNWIGILPKPIIAFFYPIYPLIQFDWCPRLLPYRGGPDE